MCRYFFQKIESKFENFKERVSNIFKILPKQGSKHEKKRKISTPSSEIYLTSYKNYGERLCSTEKKALNYIKIRFRATFLLSI